MFNKTEIKLFQTLCQLNGVSGYENKVAKYLKEQLLL